MNALRRAAVGAAALSLVGAPVRALASQVTPLLIPPVDAVIERDFREPAATWSSGHRGIDYAVATGVRVRAAASGTVRFAGSVAGHLAVTIDHGRGLETTYSILSAMEVHAGDVVGQGAYIGATGVSHPGNPDGLHFGVKLDGNYVDPVDYLGPVDVSHALHLAPLVRPSLPGGDGDSEGIEGADTRPAGCSAPGALASRPVAPNNNIAVAIAGIASDTNGTTTPDIYTSEFGPLALGYPAANVYYFSYKGDKGPHLHRPYSRSETYGDIRLAAARLRRLLLDIATRHPAADVDVIAHSQGGVVARVMLEKLVESFDPRLPRIDHLVTVATPNTGAPLARAGRGLDERTWSGRFVTGALSSWARRRGPVPDPSSVAVRQIAPGSALMDSIAAEDVTYGTQVLALAAPSDIIVPADRALYPGKRSRMVVPPGLYGHGAIVRSSHTKALEYAFLRDGPESCAGGWDVAGPLIGRAVGFVEAHIPAAYHFAEKAVARKTVGSATTGLDAVGSVRAVMKVGAGTLQRAVSDIGGPLVRGAGAAARALRSVLGRVAEPL